MQDLIDQIRDLVKAFKSTSSTGTSGSSMADKSINQLINALGQLSVKLDGTKRTRAEELQAMKRFAANVNRATTAQEAQAEAIANNIKKQKDAADAAAEAARKSALSAEELAAEQKAALQQQIKEESKARNAMLRDSINTQRRSKSSSREVFDELNATGGSLELLKDRFLNLGGDSLSAQAGLQLFASTVQGTVKALTTYSAALYKGERGAQVSAKSFSDLVNPILNTVDQLGNLVSFLSIFVPGGLLVKGAVALGGGLLSLAANAGKLAVKFQEVGAKQADDLFKSFREISQIGAATAGGMDDVFNNLQTLGMTVSEIEDYNKLIVSSGQKLGLLGAAADGGKKAFAEVAGGLVKSELGRNLELLGVSAAEQREAALTYMSIQARTGQLELKNTKQLIDESSKFVKELDMAARLTGQTRKEQEAAREANMAESRYRAALFAAQQRGDQGEIARLEKAGSMAAMLRGLGMTEQATGTLQYAAGGNAMTTPDAIQAAMSLGLAEVLNNPNITAVGALQQALGNSKEQLAYLAETNKFTGEITAIQGNIPKTLDAITRLENIQKAADKENMTVEKFLGTKQGQMMLNPEKNTKLMTDAGRAQQSAAMTMDSVVYSFNYAVDIHKAATKTFQEAVDTFAKVVGAQAPAGGTYATGGPGQGGPGPVQTAADATAIAKATREIADATAERAATAIDVENEAKRELERLKQINASKQQQQEAEKKVAAAAIDRAKLEEQERNDAYLARQRALEAKNKRLAEKKAANASVPTGPAPGGTAPAPGGTVPAPGGTAPAPGGTAPASGARAVPGTPVSAKPVACVVDAGKGFITVNTVDGDKQRREGARNWRNNNPGNIEFGDFTKRMGAVGSDGRFAVFPTLEHGSKAKEELLFGARSNYVNLSIADAISRYAPESDNNKTQDYIKSVVKALGVPPTTILGTLDSGQKSTLLNVISQVEGFREGKVLQAAKVGGILSGPTSGYLAMLHGTEAVVPLPDGKSIPVQMDSILADTVKGLTTTMVQEIRSALQQISQPQNSDQSVLVAVMQDMIREQKTTNTINQRILQVSQS